MAPHFLTCCFTHSINLVKWDINTHEIGQCVLIGRGSPCHWKVAAVQPQAMPNFLEEKEVCDGPPKWFFRRSVVIEKEWQIDHNFESNPLTLRLTPYPICWL